MFLQVDWGKGRALSHMLNALGLDDADDVIPIYLGDDRTDEDAFKVLQERATGFGILISNKVRTEQSLTHSTAHSLSWSVTDLSLSCSVNQVLTSFACATAVVVVSP